MEDLNRRVLRARDAMDRAYAEPLDVRAVAAVAHISEAHFIRTFRAVFGETPHRYLQRRRLERAMHLLRETDRSVTDISLADHQGRVERIVAGLGHMGRTNYHLAMDAVIDHYLDSGSTEPRGSSPARPAFDWRSVQWIGTNTSPRR